MEHGTEESVVELTVLAFVTAANSGDVNAVAANFADDAVLTDDVFPFAWSGPNAARDWFDAVGNHDDANGIANTLVTLVPDARTMVASGAAYTASRASFTYTQYGVAVAHDATIVCTLRQQGVQWKITSMAFGDLS